MNNEIAKELDLLMQSIAGTEYGRQMQKMAENARAWRAANPDKQALIQFNFPNHVALIAAISEAINHKYVTTNCAGLELVKALWPWDVESEPTVMMVRVVLEHEP